MAHEHVNTFYKNDFKHNLDLPHSVGAPDLIRQFIVPYTLLANMPFGFYPVTKYVLSNSNQCVSL